MIYTETMTNDWSPVDDESTSRSFEAYEESAASPGRPQSVQEVLERAGYPAATGRERLAGIRARLASRGVEIGGIADHGEGDIDIDEGTSNVLWQWQVETLDGAAE